MVATNYYGVEVLNKVKFGGKGSIVYCNMSDFDKGFIKGLIPNPKNYAFTGKKIVSLDELDKPDAEYFEITSDMFPKGNVRYINIPLNITGRESD